MGSGWLYKVSTTNSIVHHSAQFTPFWRSQQTNWCQILKSVFKVGFITQTWNYIFIFKNQWYGGLNKKVILDCLSFFEHWRNLVVPHSVHFRLFLKVLADILMLHSQISFKVGDIIWIQKIIFFLPFLNKYSGSWNFFFLENWKVIFFFIQVTIAFISK